MVVLTACSNSSSNASSNSSMKEPLTLSEGLKKYPVWFYSAQPGKDETIISIYVFDENTVTVYEPGNDLKMRELSGLSDEEVIEIAKETSEETYNNVPYYINLVTDETGNAVESEEIYFEDNNIYNKTTISLGEYEIGQIYEVYNDYYVGMRDSFIEGYASVGDIKGFFTRVENGHPGFIMDSLGTEGLLVDTGEVYTY